ncbi:VOC family protein [Herbidospora cretacea]|uniref:VOC family protein n=1 Tax=Herbidospora cretacea TaxID=28444 RepID=UPI0004C371A8|nr:VOC family protein [Herbidospora cretacea]
MDGFPIIEVADLDLALSFYRDGLGGVIDYRFPPDGDAAYVNLRVGEATLGLGVVPGPAPAPGPVLLWFYVEDVDATTADLARRGFTVVEQPADQSWGERVSLVLDPAGIRVRLGQSTS